MIPHGDIVCVIHPNQHIVQRGWRILTPHENKDDNYDDGDDDDDDHDHDHDHDHDDCKCGATSGLGRPYSFPVCDSMMNHCEPMIHHYQPL